MNGLTDYATDTDEIEMMVGVDEYFVYMFNNLYRPKSIYTLSTDNPKHISFPCFEESALWVELTEIDSTDNDKIQISMDCKKL